MALPNFLRELKSALDHEFKKNLYRNLVFSGGGVRGIAYLGALESLSEYQILDNIQRVAGTSAGAISAVMTSFRLPVAETRELFDSLDFRRIPQAITRDQPRRLLSFPEEASTRRFFRDYGWYSSEYFYSWFQDVIASQNEGDPRATFWDFRERGFRDLFIVATNLSRQRAEVFSWENTPDVAVADAVRMSMSIPIFFEALRFNGREFGKGDYYVDGGLFDNFPVHIFDRGSYATRGWTFRDGVNWETLGLFLFPQAAREEGEPEHPDNVWDFLNLMLQNLYHSHEVGGYQTSPVDRERTIEIGDCGIPPTDFEVDRGDSKYQQLYTSGREAVRDFFS